MKRILLAIRRWRDHRFLRRLERVLQENIIKASPILDGYVVLSGDQIITGTPLHKPIDRIRYDIERPNPVRIVVGGDGVIPLSRNWEGVRKAVRSCISDIQQQQSESP